MKRILGFLVGLVLGFFLIETLSGPPAVKETVAAVRPADAIAVVTESSAEAAPAVVGPPSSTESLADRLARARPAREAPAAFFFARGLLRSSFTLPEWRSDADRAEDAFELARRSARSRYASLADLLELDEAKRELLFEAIAQQAVALGPETSPPPDDSAPRLRLMERLSQELEQRLARAFSPEELEALAAARFLPDQLARVAAAFGERGLPLSREQMHSLFSPYADPYAMGPTLYRQLRFDPFAGVGLTPEQWAYLAKEITWRNALQLTGIVENTKVRDPEVWDLWPN